MFTYLQFQLLRILLWTPHEVSKLALEVKLIWISLKSHLLPCFWQLSKEPLQQTGVSRTTNWPMQVLEPLLLLPVEATSLPAKTSIASQSCSCFPPTVVFLSYKSVNILGVGDLELVPQCVELSVIQAKNKPDLYLCEATYCLHLYLNIRIHSCAIKNICLQSAAPSHLTVIRYTEY